MVGVMSHYEYEESQQISARNYGFYALIMSAMRQADTDNTCRLRQAFPEVWAELEARYHAPGGVIASDYTERRTVVVDLDKEEAEMSDAENTTECVECGTTILKEDAVEYGGGDYCSQECADTHELEEADEEEHIEGVGTVPYPKEVNPPREVPGEVPPPMQSETGG